MAEKRSDERLGAEGGGGRYLSPSPTETMTIMGDHQRGGGGEEPTMRTVETLLRLLPVALCVTSLVVMLKASQTNDFGSVSYSNLGAFKYLVHANGICAGYSLLSAVVAAVPSPATMSRAWTFFLLDQVLTYIILAAGSGSAEVAYLAYRGDEAVAWSDTCTSFGSFCRKATAAIAITFGVMLCFTGLSLISSYRLFSKYDAPAVANSSSKE